jgi:bzd-type benzoyl-CoA reductase N subunit
MAKKLNGRKMKRRLILDELRGIAEAPFPYLLDLKRRRGKRILGYFCINTPEEIIQAAGLLPVRILGSKGSISLASRHLQSYSCSLIQSSLEGALKGELNFLDGTVFPHTCDSIQRLSDIWAENLRFPFHWDIVLPVKLHTESARAYLIQELRRFRGGLQQFTGQAISDQDLRASIALANESRSLLRECYRRRADHPGIFSGAEFLALVKTAAFLPKEEHTAKLRELLAHTPGMEPTSPERVRLFLAGSVCDQAPVLDIFEASGASIVGDDLCTGWRHIAEDVSQEGDPMEALADRLIRRVPCPCKYNPRIDRAKDFVRRVAASRAHGVVFILLKFCDPHAFDFPYLKGKLDESKIPSLILEIEPGIVPVGALETRLQAFIETLGG